MAVLSGRLYERLDDGQDNLKKALARVYEESLAIWEHPSLKEFTDHGEAHTRQVVRNLDDLTEPFEARGSRLDGYETYVLLAAACLHDIGMQLGDPGAREQHAQSAYELILYSHAQYKGVERKVTLPIGDTGARQAIARVARAHWCTHALCLGDEAAVFGNEMVRQRLLGLLLAMADLLDLSPLRANYYRSPHRLYDLGAESQLHQAKHELVDHFRILPDDNTLDLQFRLVWKDDGDDTRDLSDWVLGETDAYWRRMAGELRVASGGILNWQRPWCLVEHREAEGPLPELSEASRQVLHFALAKQRLVDRQAFCEGFHDAIAMEPAAEGGTLAPQVYIYPASGDADHGYVQRWCLGRAHITEGCRVAQFGLPSLDPTLNELVGNLLEQLNDHRPAGNSEEEALERLEWQVAQQAGPVAILLDDPCGLDEAVSPILERVLVPSRYPRVCLAFRPVGCSQLNLEGVTVVSAHAPPFSGDEVTEYLRQKRGVSDHEASQAWERIVETEQDTTPMKVYKYISAHYRLPVAEPS